MLMHGTCATHLLDNSLAPVIGSCYAAIILERHMQRLALIRRLPACIACYVTIVLGALLPQIDPHLKARWLTVLHRLIRQAEQVHCGANDGAIFYRAFRQAVPQVQQAMIHSSRRASSMQEAG